MNRPFVALLLAASVTALAVGCSSDEPSPSEENGGSGGAGALGGASVGGSAGAATGGSSGASSGAGSGGTSSGGSATGGSSSGGSDTGGSDTGGAAGSAGDAGSGGTTGGSGGAMGGSPTGGAGGAGMGGGGGAAGGSAGGANAMMNFFVTSDTSETGNIGGLMMADMRCQTLAAAVGHGSKTWRAYLSVESPMTHAINRIGEGPYYNSMGMLVAMDKAALHERAGDAAIFIDERGNRVNGQWSGSPTPNQHDVLTGSQENGMLSMGNTCSDWTATTGNAQVGHSDGLGPNMATTGTYTIWNGSHTSNCGNLASTGGAGKLYCFVGP